MEEGKIYLYVLEFSKHHSFKHTRVNWNQLSLRFHDLLNRTQLEYGNKELAAAVVTREKAAPKR